MQSYSYRIDLSYIGTDFMGWQSQPHKNTIQDILEKALAVVVRRPVRVIGASRTDTGVHAEHQVAIFKLEQELDCGRVLRSMQALVPSSIGIYRLVQVEPDFHPIRDAEAKLYRYRIWMGQGMHAFLKSSCWHIPLGIDLSAMQEAASSFVGKHDFKSFAATDTSAKTFERRILDVRWRCSDERLVEIYVLGEGFLKQMMRNIVGTLVEVGQGKRERTSISEILLARDRRMAGKTAPAQGLSLVQIFYQSIAHIPQEYIADNTGFALPNYRL